MRFDIGDIIKHEWFGERFSMIIIDACKDENLCVIQYECYCIVSKRVYIYYESNLLTLISKGEKRIHEKDR